jgi:hypothetical protein
VRWDQDAGLITAALTVTGPHGARARVSLRYLDHVPHPTAVLTGRAGDARLAAAVPAP